MLAGSNLGRAVALLDREELLTEQARHVDPASYRMRFAIEDELADIRRQLIALGFRKNP